VFQNRKLAESAIARLTGQGQRVHLPRDVPANDGGLAFGQLIEVLHGGGVPL
jgi:hydrogenase maturation protein HypF